MDEDKRQSAKERAVLLALQNNVALVRRGLEIHGMKRDGSTKLISKSDRYEELWHDALNALKRHVAE